MTVELNRSRLLEVIREAFSYRELMTLSALLKVDFDSLRGEDASAKARELVAYMERHDRLQDLANLVQYQRPLLEIEQRAKPLPAGGVTSSTLDAEVLSIELTSLRQQLEEIQKEAVSDTQLEYRLQEILKTADRAVGQSEDLTARVILPRKEDMNVKLVPLHSFERLEEYRADENIAYLLIGSFGGAILGILSNWATTRPFVVTEVSVILLLLLVILIGLCLLWLRRLARRSESVKQDMFSLSSGSEGLG